MFIVSLVVIIVLVVVNFFSGKKGTYQDHTKLIIHLLQEPYVGPQRTQGDSMQKRPSSSPLSDSFVSKGEEECRRAIEKLTGKAFPQSRPSFLYSAINGGHNLELDCYCPELKLAIEYNGRQHYEFNPYFHKNKEAFLNTRYRDDMKERLCRENGVRLIVVPYTVKITKIYDYIKDKLKLL